MNERIVTGGREERERDNGRGDKMINSLHLSSNPLSLTL